MLSRVHSSRLTDSAQPTGQINRPWWEMVPSLLLACDHFRSQGCICQEESINDRSRIHSSQWLNHQLRRYQQLWLPTREHLIQSPSHSPSPPVVLEPRKALETKDNVIIEEMLEQKQPHHLPSEVAGVKVLFPSSVLPFRTPALGTLLGFKCC